ncbi:unnamed protein product [Bathycoccus prasinos]|jgi:hypothetical protein
MQETKEQTTIQTTGKKKGALSSALTQSLINSDASSLAPICTTTGGFGNDSTTTPVDDSDDAQKRIGIAIHKRTNNYGDSSRGRHGREYFDDEELHGKSIGRQHGSYNYIEKFADVNDIEAMGSPTSKMMMSGSSNDRDHNSYLLRRQNSAGGGGGGGGESTSVGARTIPQVHVYAESNAIPISRSFENLEVGPMGLCGSPSANAGGQPSSPVIVVHTKEMDEDAGNVGMAGGRNRSRSFSSLLLLEAQEIRAGNSPRHSRLSGAEA